MALKLLPLLFLNTQSNLNVDFSTYITTVNTNSVQICAITEEVNPGGTSTSSALCGCQSGNTNTCQTSNTYDVGTLTGAIYNLGATNNNLTSTQLLNYRCSYRNNAEYDTNIERANCTHENITSFVWDGDTCQTNSYNNLVDSCPHCSCMNTSQTKYVVVEKYKQKECYFCQCMDRTQGLHYECTSINSASNPTSMKDFQCGPWYNVGRCGYDNNNDDVVDSYRTGCGDNPCVSYKIVDKTSNMGNNDICEDNTVKSAQQPFGNYINTDANEWGCQNQDYPQHLDNININPRIFAAVFGFGNFMADIELKKYVYDCRNSTWFNVNYNYTYYLAMCNDKPECNTMNNRSEAVANADLKAWIEKERTCNKYKKYWYMTETSDRAMAYSKYASECGAMYDKSTVQPCDRLRTQRDDYICECEMYQYLRNRLPASNSSFAVDLNSLYNSGNSSHVAYETWNSWNEYYNCGLGALSFCDVATIPDASKGYIAKYIIAIIAVVAHLLN